VPEQPGPKTHAHPSRREPAHAPRRERRPPPVVPDLPGYAELQVASNFSFLRGASHPDELVDQAAKMGYAAVAITDVNTLAGVVRGRVAARDGGVPFVVGCRLELRRGGAADWPRGKVKKKGTPPEEPALSLLVYPTDRASYGRLCRLLTRGKRRAPKGECWLGFEDLAEFQEGLLAIALPPEGQEAFGEGFARRLEDLRGLFDLDRLSLASSCLHGPDDERRLERLAALAREHRIPLVATNDVHYHIPRRRPVQDVLVCIRHTCTIREAGFRLFPHGERHLKGPEEMARLFARYPQALQRTVEIARRASGFSLDELRYEYPREVCPDGLSPMAYLRKLTWEGVVRRFAEEEKGQGHTGGRAGAEAQGESRESSLPHRIPPSLHPSTPSATVPSPVILRLEHEFELIESLDYAKYFLTVNDIVRQARSLGILCQGRGAAANSAVCYYLGITAVDPMRIDMLFERFVSKERNEPPDIDIDFEHERREEVIQYIYGKYGRDRAALCAEVISYRGRSAIRDVGKAMGLSLDLVDRMARQIDWWDGGLASDDRLAELGLDPRDATIRMTLSLAREILGFPRHLSQHVGGFVITQSALEETVPIENAAMPDRTVIEWDKDDIDAMGMLKVDCLGLGMLTALARCLAMVNQKASRCQDVEVPRGSGAGTIVFQSSLSQETSNGSDPLVPGPHCLAERQGAEQEDLSRDREDASLGAFRADGADAASRRLDPLEYRRGIQPQDRGGAHPRAADRVGIAGRTLHAVGDRDRAGDDPQRPDHSGIDGRSGPAAFRAHSESGYTEERVNPVFRSAPRHLDTSTPPLRLDTIPPEDPAVYDMICRADTVGVFQIESRAQMSMLPRLRPRSFYDLVIEVAIVRPGPIQGDMVHPYLRRRNGEEPVEYVSPAVRGVLEKTLGVPLFQEQCMALAIKAAGFTPGEADQLRRAMAAWKRKGEQIHRFGQRLIEGMLARGIPREFAERCFEQIKGFSEYGFPESHAASFALLVYASAWLKCHHPAEFTAALLNSQPMGFYAPAQLVRDAREHGVEVRPIDVNHSRWDCTIEGGALRLGLRLAQGIGEEQGGRIEKALAGHGPSPTMLALWRRSGAKVSTLRKLAAADAFGSMGLTRQEALWHARQLRDDRLPLFEGAPEMQEPAPLPAVGQRRQVVLDYASTGLSLKAHPVAFVRERLKALGAVPCEDLRDPARTPDGRPVAVGGLVLVRQRPGTASGVTFMTLEDETGIANLVVWRDIYERFRHQAASRLLVAKGRVQRQGDVVHITVAALRGMDPEAQDLDVRSRDFH
jgi:error-prone DNA polymerase